MCLTHNCLDDFSCNHITSAPCRNNVVVLAVIVVDVVVTFPVVVFVIAVVVEISLVVVVATVTAALLFQNIVTLLSTM